jgi:NitT/TauT family transport system permease protein/taurine transport system permease protein
VKKKGFDIYTFVSILSVIGFFFIWWLITDGLHIVRSVIMPSPGTVGKAFLEKLVSRNPDGGYLHEHIAASLQVALTGYVLGACIGIPTGILMAWFPLFDKFYRPIFNLIRPISPIAWIPIMILWFGIGLGSKAALIFLSAFVPSVVNAYAGIKSANPVHYWVAQTFGASRKVLLFKIAIPSALPHFFTGLKVSLGSAMTSLVAAELLAATRGLGYMIQLNRRLGRVDNIVVGMLTVGALGAIFAVTLDYLEKKLVKGGTKRD